MKVIIGSDHAGFSVKERLKCFLAENNIETEDVGPYSEDSVDYPDYAKKVAKKVADNKELKGILICGSGTGMAMAANKIKGIRAAVGYDTYIAEMSRLHNDANVLCLREREFPYEKTKEIVDVWLKTPFSNDERHKRRIEKIE